jgi:EAL and modified HD-GYP domain-containing signal transduction protein
MLSDKTPVFINFGREMLLSNWTSLFPPSVVVIEILESVTADPPVIAACAALKENGYVLALDDIIDSPDVKFLELVDIIKIDFRGTSPETQARLAREHKGAGRRLLAEKVETREEFERAKQLGFDLFQGFFFSKPVLMQGRHVAAMTGSVLKLLMELGSPEINFKRLEDLIRCDVSLTYKLLRYVNSALFARKQPISGIIQALVAMGELDIRRWIVLATLLDLSGKTQILATHALVRARFCENIATSAGSGSPADAFLMGMFSLLDALVHRPLSEILVELGLPSEMLATLLGREVQSKNAFSLLLAKCYESGEWEAVSESACRLGLSNELVAGMYLASVNWANQMLAVGDSGTQTLPEGGKLTRGSGRDLAALQSALEQKPAESNRVSALEQMRSRR